MIRTPTREALWSRSARDRLGPLGRTIIETSRRLKDSQRLRDAPVVRQQRARLRAD